MRGSCCIRLLRPTPTCRSRSFGPILGNTLPDLDDQGRPLPRDPSDSARRRIADGTISRNAVAGVGLFALCASVISQPSDGARAVGAVVLHRLRPANRPGRDRRQQHPAKLVAVVRLIKLHASQLGRICNRRQRCRARTWFGVAAHENARRYWPRRKTRRDHRTNQHEQSATADVCQKARF